MKQKTASHSENSPRPAGWVLVLEPSEQLASEIKDALREAAPDANVEVARTLEEAQRLVLDAKPDLFVLDLDATYDLGQDFLFDLRTSHSNAKAIILTAAHLQAHREQAKGLGAIHFLEKPFPRADFVDLTQALFDPSSKTDSEKFQGTLSDLHFADIIQLKCMSGSTSVLEFTGPKGQKARVFFDNGQVRHAVAPGQDGIEAFNEILTWKGGMISEVSGAGTGPRTIDLDWQILLMEGVRQIDETREKKKNGNKTTNTSRKILVIDDSLMLLSFVNEILTESNYQVTTAPTAEEGLRAASEAIPDLILLDYVLPDIKGDEVSRRLASDSTTEKIPVLYMSGLGTDLKSDQSKNPNVIGFLNKPFTSETLIKTIETYLPKAKDQMEDAEVGSEKNLSEPADEPLESTPEFARISEEIVAEKEDNAESSQRWDTPPEIVGEKPSTESFAPAERFEPASSFEASEPRTSYMSEMNDVIGQDTPAPLPPDGGAFFSGDTSFFSLHWALQTIGKEKLTGTLSCFWDKAAVELLARKGRIVLVTTHDPELYCSEAPITLVNLDPEKIAQSRQTQNQTGAPLFITLAREDLILREPAQQLVQHYGQKLFAQLWTAKRVRFVFEQSEQLPDYASDVPSEEDTDQWSLNTLRFIQYQELESSASYSHDLIPGFTRDGFERVQNLRLTVAEAQFASQFNGARSIAQIAKNLRLDLKFARLTLFRFRALEIVELWPPGMAEKQEKRGLLERFGFGG